MRIEMDTKNLENGINRLVKSLTFEKPVNEILGDLEDESQKNFEQKGFFYGAWKALTASTKRDRQKHGFNPSGPILVRTGRLKGSFRKKRTKENEGEFYNMSSIAKYHQFGTNKMPVRKIVGVSKKIEGAAVRRVADYIAKQIREKYG